MSEIKKYRGIRAGEAKLTKGFWANRVSDYMMVIENLEATLLEENNAARLLNFGIAAGVLEGEFYENEWSDGDCYKFIEGCCYQYASTGDQAILDIVNKYIPWIMASQEEDGYINTQVTLTDRERWTDVVNHELYNLGHLFTASVVMHDAVGDDRLLEVAKRAADYLCSVFIPLNKNLGDFGFNPSQIMGLVDLYSLTSERRYLELADIFVTMRGTKLGNADYNQNRVALRDEVKPVGHAVTAAYLFAGATDVYSHTDDETLIIALERIWNDMIEKRIYITGGVCPIYDGLSERGDMVHEGFGDEYNLPHRIAYNETCANIGTAMWARRMYDITGKAIYGDWMETILFNAGISGSNLEMTRYFYANPLAHRAKHHIVPTFGQYKNVPNERFRTHLCWCCPPQLWRTYTGMANWIYSTTEDGISINLFAGSVLMTKLMDGSDVKLTMTSNYPWEGEVEIDVEQAPAEGMNLKLRIPNWCDNATYNGGAIKSGTHLIRVASGEKISINLPMEVSLYESNPMLEQANGMLAVKRGSVIYCLEGHDIADDVTIDELAIKTDQVFVEETIKDLPYDMVGLRTELQYKPKGEGLYHKVTSGGGKSINVRMIPYFAWANRAESDMSVWLPKA